MSSLTKNSMCWGRWGTHYEDWSEQDFLTFMSTGFLPYAATVRKIIMESLKGIYSPNSALLPHLCHSLCFTPLAKNTLFIPGVLESQARVGHATSSQSVFCLRGHRQCEPHLTQEPVLIGPWKGSSVPDLKKGSSMGQFPKISFFNFSPNQVPTILIAKSRSDDFPAKYTHTTLL